MTTTNDIATEQGGEVLKQTTLDKPDSTTFDGEILSILDVMAITGMTREEIDRCIAFAAIPPAERDALMAEYYQSVNEYGEYEEDDQVAWVLRRANATKRRGRGKSADSLNIIAKSIAILREIQPASVRAVCYQLFTRKLIPNMSKNSTGKVGKLLVSARESGELPWDWIVDETRAAETISTWDNPESVISAAVSQYRKDYWATQPNRVEVWSEKGTIRGTVAPILKKYGVTFRVMHGYGSATSIHGIAQETMGSDKPFVVLYIGDHDPSGMHMSEIDLPERLARYGGRAKIIRIALDASDVTDDTELPWFPASDKTGDSRHGWFTKLYGQRCWEVDALSPVVLRDRLDNAIGNLLDLNAWNHAVKIEAAEVESMQNILGNWKKSISQQASKCSDRGRP